jgi:glyoxylase-like metal-dependent hydrolase (beta-lactamase superfamily II)
VGRGAEIKFTALPVTQGDAFYAETDDGFRVLVDGGRSRCALPELFRKYTKSDRVDVLVCTHNDADHAEGVLGFLENGLGCGELWLPATWLDALRSLPPDAHGTWEFLWDHFTKLDRQRLLAQMEGNIQETAWRVAFPDLQGEGAQESRAEETSAAQSDKHEISPSVALRDVLDAIDEG